MVVTEGLVANVVPLSVRCRPDSFRRHPGIHSAHQDPLRNAKRERGPGENHAHPSRATSDAWNRQMGFAHSRAWTVTGTDLARGRPTTAPSAETLRPGRRSGHRPDDRPRRHERRRRNRGPDRPQRVRPATCTEPSAAARSGTRCGRSRPTTSSRAPCPGGPGPHRTRAAGRGSPYKRRRSHPGASAGAPKSAANDRLDADQDTLNAPRALPPFGEQITHYTRSEPCSESHDFPIQLNGEIP